MSYYRTEEGKVKKQFQNSKRNRQENRLSDVPSSVSLAPPTHPDDSLGEITEDYAVSNPYLDTGSFEMSGAANSAVCPDRALPSTESERRGQQEAKPKKQEMLCGGYHGSGFDAGMVLYLVMVISLIESRVVNREEIVQMLARGMRQHSFARRKRADYLVWHLNTNPP